MPHDYIATKELLDVTIPVSGTTSGEIDIRAKEVVGAFIPSTFDGTVLYLQAATVSGGTFARIQDGAGADVSFTVTAGKPFAVSNLALIAGWRFIKLEAGTAQSSTDTVITIVTRPL